MTGEQAYIAIKQVLTLNGYKELPGLVNIEEVKTSHNNLGFILQPIGSREEQMLGCVSTENNWMLEIVYLHNDAQTRVTNYDLFHQLKITLNNVSGFMGWLSEPKYERLANHTNCSKGTLEFIFGLQGY